MEEETQRPTSSSSLVFREIHIQIALSYHSKASDGQKPESCLMSAVGGVWESENPQVLLMKFTQLQSFWSANWLVRQINHRDTSNPATPRYKFPGNSRTVA